MSARPVEPALVRDYVDYDPTTGLFFWRPRDRSHFANARTFGAWNARYAGKRAFAHIDTTGYLRGNIHRAKVYAHRAAFAWAHGRWPAIIDHINGVRTDNRLVNLRECSHAENVRNSKARAASGFKGVFPNGERWFARIRRGDEIHYLGTFNTRTEAAGAYDAAARQLHGDFARLNFPPLDCA